jgi:hypothetical protein
MARVPEYYNVGDRSDMTVERLLVIVEDLYRQLAVALNQKTDLVQRTTDGLTTDVFLSQGTFNINLNTNKVEMLTNHTSSTSVTWTTLS